jgi:hypothetical protein
MVANSKIMVLTPGIPHSRIGASAVLFYYYMEAIKEWGRHTQNLLLIQKENNNEEHLLQYKQKFHDESQFEVVPLIFNAPLIESYFWKFRIRPDVYSAVIKRINDYKPDILICVDLISAWLAIETNCKNKIVWLGDLNFQTFWYRALYSLLERRNNIFKSVVLLIFASLQCWSWRSIYSRVLSKMNLIVVSSKISEKTLDGLGIQSKYLPYPWPNYFTCKESSGLPEKPTFLFYGTLKALGSRSSFRFIIHKLYQRLVSLWGRNGFKISIAGRGGLYSWVERELSTKPELEYLGFVENLDVLMKSCHAVLVPIDIPVGNRSRILTAMANKTLVIAHKNTSLANPELSDGQTCLLADNVDEFCEKMSYAYQRSDKIDQIIDRAYHMYMGQFHPDSAKKIFINHIAQYLGANKGVN